MNNYQAGDKMRWIKHERWEKMRAEPEHSHCASVWFIWGNNLVNWVIHSSFNFSWSTDSVLSCQNKWGYLGNDFSSDQTSDWTLGLWSVNHYVQPQDMWIIMSHPLTRRRKPPVLVISLRPEVLIYEGRKRYFCSGLKHLLLCTLEHQRSQSDIFLKV